MTTKICPLLTVARTLRQDSDITHLFVEYCYESECAWFNEETGLCGMVSQSNNVYCKEG